MLSVSEGVRVRQWVYLHTGTLPVAGNLKSGKTLRHSKQLELEGRRLVVFLNHERLPVFLRIYSPPSHECEHLNRSRIDLSCNVSWQIAIHSV